jgi:hypothetical protein
MKKWFYFCFQRELTIIEKRDFILEYINDIVPFVNLSQEDTDSIKCKLMERKCSRKDLYQNI